MAGNDQQDSTQSVSGFKRSISYLLVKLQSCPGIHVFFKNTFAGGLKYANHQLKKGRPIRALGHLLKMLGHKKYAEDPKKWWYLMRQAVAIAQDQQLSHHEMLIDEVKALFLLIQNPPQILVNYDVAYSYVGFSLWSFQSGQTDEAVEYAQCAAKSDEGWGYPDYLLGWYGLLGRETDAVQHFTKALTCNWSFFQRMSKDPICRKHPDVIRQVKQNVLMDGKRSENAS